MKLIRGEGYAALAKNTEHPITNVLSDTKRCGYTGARGITVCSAGTCSSMSPCCTDDRSGRQVARLLEHHKAHDEDNDYQEPSKEF